MSALDPELLAVFLPEARACLDQMASDDRETQLQAAHALRGACSMVGLHDLAKAASALEDLLRAGHDGSSERLALAAALKALSAHSTPEPPRAPAEPLGDNGDWDPDELRGLRAFFLDEATEHLEAIEAGLMALAAEPGALAPVQQVLRKLHTFKGSAGSVQLGALSRIAHDLEEHLIRLRDSGVPLDAGALAALDGGAEALRRGVAEVAREVRDPPAATRAAAAATSAANRRFLDRREPDAQTVRVEVQRIDELMDAASELVFDRTRVARRLQELEGCVRDLAKTRNALASALGSLDVLPGGAEAAARFTEIATELSDVLGQLTRAVQGAGEDAEGLQRTSATLQLGIRHVRMMAVGRLFARLEQPVRELARRDGKQVMLRASGEETEIDKAVVERIAEPLLHLLRNAVAHGIETPEARRAAGKHETGVITISARQDGDATEIVVSDDGRGIDRAAVRHALVAGGRLAASDADELDESSLFGSLFEPGVSTRMQADDLAGRGVGLDAVKDAIARLGGSVRVTSAPGRGASFIVRLPLTTAVQQALLFKVGGQVYAVPAAHVEEAVQVTADDIRSGHGPEQIALAGPEGTRVLPLVRLGALLGVPAPPGSTRRSALVITSGDERFALTCDKVIGPREIVMRSLGPLLDALPLYAGATISGAGKVQLILDVAYLHEVARRGVHLTRPTRALGPRRVLVVDDSRAIREAAQLILLQGGYSVETVPDGWDAWELLQDRPFDLLLTDLEMPRLDGHELIARVRRSPELQKLPVVVVSSRTADTMRTRVLSAGADGFVGKPLRRKSLLEAVDGALSRAR